MCAPSSLHILVRPPVGKHSPTFSLPVQNLYASSSLRVPGSARRCRQAVLCTQSERATADRLSRPSYVLHWKLWFFVLLQNWIYLVFMAGLHTADRPFCTSVARSGRRTKNHTLLKRQRAATGACHRRADRLNAAIMPFFAHLPLGGNGYPWQMLQNIPSFCLLL